MWKRMKKAVRRPENECPKLQEGDVLSVELTPTGSSERGTRPAPHFGGG